MSIWSWFLIGAASWVLGIVLKVAADFFVQRSSLPELRDWAAALLSGVWSTVCELGLFAFAIWFWSATFADTMVAALGAAMAEFVILLPAIISAHLAKSQGKTKDKANWHAFFTERSLFIGNHILCRALLWLGLGGRGGLAAFAAAFGFFILTETAQAYGQAKEWNWLDKKTQIIFFVFVGLVLAAELALILYWW